MKYSTENFALRLKLKMLIYLAPALHKVLAADNYSIPLFRPH